MKYLLFLLTRKSQLFCRFLFLLLLPTAQLITTSPAKALSFSPTLQLAQGDNQQVNVLEKKGKDFIGLLNEKKYQEALGYFSPELQKELKTNNLKDLWQTLAERYGKYKNISSIKFNDALNVKILDVDVQFANSPKTIKLVFNNNSELIGINIPLDQKDETIEQLSRNFFEALAQGKYVEARYNLHPYLKAEFTPEDIQTRWQKIDQQFGGFKQIVNIQSAPGETQSQADIAIVTIEFNNTVRNAVLIFDSDKQIIGVDLENIFTK